MTRNILYVLLASLAIHTLAACSQDTPSSADPDALTGRLTLTGSSTIAPLAGEIGKRFEQLNPGTRIDVQTGGSSRGVADVRRGTANVGMVSRELNAQENDLAGTTIALDGIAVIVNSSNVLAELSREQIIDIYTGHITNWKDIGGHDAAITVINKAEGRSTLELFLSHFVLRNEDIRPSLIIGDNQQGIRSVASDPNAIAYVSIGTAAFEAARGTTIRALPLNGVEATLENVRNGSFPLSRPLLLVTFDPEGQAESATLQDSFIEYAASEAVNDLIESQYFVPLSN